MSRQAAQDWLCSKLGIELPYYPMGKVDSYDLFGPNELILFAFYEHNRDRYRKVLDIGANVGLHSMLMRKLGWDVKSFEPDPQTFKELQHNVGIECFNAAVAEKDGVSEFVRVMNNLTGSCLQGAAKEPYGPMQRIEVKTVDCRPLFDWADLAKIDVEGYESHLLLTLTKQQLSKLDLVCELRGVREAAKVMAHIHNIGGQIYTQKNDWKPVTCMAQMPIKHQEGSIFISSTAGPWE